MTRILGGSQNRQKCPKKRHLVLYKLAGFYPDGLTRRSVFKRVGGRGNPQKWPIFGPFLGVNCAKPELIPGVPPVCSHAARHIMGGDWPVGLTVTKAHSVSSIYIFYNFHFPHFVCFIVPRCATPNTVPRCAFLGNSMGLPP